MFSEFLIHKHINLPSLSLHSTTNHILPTLSPPPNPHPHHLSQNPVFHQPCQPKPSSTTFFLSKNFRSTPPRHASLGKTTQFRENRLGLHHDTSRVRKRFGAKVPGDRRLETGRRYVDPRAAGRLGRDSEVLEGLRRDGRGSEGMEGQD